MLVALRLASTVSLVWFLYWICYDVVVWSKPLFRVNFVNYVGAVLSLAVMFAGFLLGAKNAVGASGGGQDDERRVLVERGGVEVKTRVVERCGEGDESSVLYDLEGDGSSTLRGLEEEVGSLTREKRDLLALRERLELEARQKAEVRRRSVDALRGEVAELRRQVDELKARLKAMQ
jgi:hypothetical protein